MCQCFGAYAWLTHRSTHQFNPFSNIHRYGETETRLDAVLKLVLETRYAQTDVNVRLETSATGL